MKTKTKIVIFLIAILLSLMEFNLIVSFCCFDDVLNAGKKTAYEIAAKILSMQEKPIGNN